jgi:hypothetical protein
MLRPVYLYWELTLFLLLLCDISFGSRGRKTLREKSGHPTFLTGACASIVRLNSAFSLLAFLGTPSRVDNSTYSVSVYSGFGSVSTTKETTCRHQHREALR